MAGSALAGGGKINGDGNVELVVHFRFPPLQPDIDRVKEQVQRASELMCDATEGQMKIAKARLMAGGASETAGDVWLYPPGAINRSRSDGGPMDNPGSRIHLQYKNMRSDVLFHEMGHLVFSLGDQYNEQRRMGDACGNGPAFDEGVLLDELNHTIMQQPGFQRCVTAAFDPTNRSCYNASDCMPGETCPLPNLSSEFSVDANYDLLRGDSVLLADTCPGIRTGNMYQISGFVGEDTTMTAFDPTDLATAKSSSGVETAREYLDEQGVVTGYDTGSAHPVWLFSERVGAQAWTLHFGMDGKHLDGEDPGDLVILGSVDVEFEAMPSKTIVAFGDPDRHHRILEKVNGVLISDVGYIPPVITIPALANGASSVGLTLDFVDFEERESWTGGTVGASDILSSGLQQLGTCTATMACEQRWNTVTQRWETTASTKSALDDGVVPSSEWTRLVQNVDSFYGLTWLAPAGLPMETTPGGFNCNAAVSFNVQVEGVDQVYLVMDRSFSMDEERDWLGNIKTRMDWAKAGARGFADLMTGEGVDVGLISFNLEIKEKLGLQPIQEDGAGIPDTHEISTVKDKIDSLNPANNTAIGDALELARLKLEDAKVDGRTQAVMLLSDGDENGGVLDPSDVANDLEADGVLVYAVPLGNDSDGELLAAIADTTGGDVYDARSPDELPPLYAQLWGRMRGETPIWANVPSQTMIISDNFSLATHAIRVEEGSAKLSVMISGRGEDPWDPDCFLVPPTMPGTISCDDASSVVSDEFYKIIRVPNPEPGIWALQVIGDSQLQSSYIWAHSNNPAPDCWAGASPTFMTEEPAEGALIRAGASYGAPLGRNVVYYILIQTPNGTVLPLDTMDINDRQNGAEYRFSNFQGRGSYKVMVTCVVTEDSEFSPGEHPDLVDILADEPPVAFSRQAKTSFFLDSSDYPPPPTGDPDCVFNTGDPNGLNDDDDDGVQNYCDPDDDGDEVPDTEDLCPNQPESFDFGSIIDGCPDPDLDLDGLIDSQEILHGTLLTNPDTDGDGLLDGEEVYVYFTDPLDPDSDGDGISDGDEVMNGTDPNVPTTDLSVLSGRWVQLLFAAMLAVIGAHMARRTRYSI